MSYCTPAEVAAYLGRSLSADQLTQAQLYADAATAWIEQYTGKVWDSTSPTTEKKTIYGNRIRLSNVPVIGITSISVREVYPGSTSVVLDADVAYELIDADKGIIEFNTYYGGMYSFRPGYSNTVNYMATVTYTHSESVPANVKLATIKLAAHNMISTLNPGTQRLKSMNDNRAVSVTFKDDSFPKDIFQLLPPKATFVV